MITITLGYWLIPTAATLILYGFWYAGLKTRTNDDFGIGAIVDGVTFLLYTVPVLIAWLIYAFLT